jgi:hypothetical protein
MLSRNWVGLTGFHTRYKRFYKFMKSETRKRLKGRNIARNVGENTVE